MANLHTRFGISEQPSTRSCHRYSQTATVTGITSIAGYFICGAREQTRVLAVQPRYIELLSQSGLFLGEYPGLV